MRKLASAKTALKAKKHTLGHKLFANLSDGHGVRLDESLDARAGAVYFLAKCKIVPLPPTGTSFACDDPLVQSLLQQAVKGQVIEDDA